MKHKFIFNLYEAFPDADYIKAILDRCSLAGNIVLKYKLDVDTTRKQREFIMTVWTRRGKDGAR